MEWVHALTQTTVAQRRADGAQKWATDAQKRADIAQDDVRLLQNDVRFLQNDVREEQKRADVAQERANRAQDNVADAKTEVLRDEARRRADEAQERANVAQAKVACAEDEARSIKEQARVATAYACSAQIDVQVAASRSFCTYVFEHYDWATRPNEHVPGLVSLFGYQFTDDPRVVLKERLSRNWNVVGADKEMLSMISVAGVGGQGKTEFCRTSSMYLEGLDKDTFRGIHYILPLIATMGQGTAYNPHEDMYAGDPIVWRLIAGLCGEAREAALETATKYLRLADVLNTIRISYGLFKKCDSDKIGIVLFVDETMNIPVATRNVILDSLSSMHQSHQYHGTFTQFVVTSLEVSPLREAIEVGSKRHMFIIPLPMMEKTDAVCEIICNNFKKRLGLTERDEDALKTMTRCVGALLSVCGRHFRTLEKALSQYWLSLCSSKLVDPVSSTSWFGYTEQLPQVACIPLRQIVHAVAPSNIDLFEACTELFVQLLQNPKMCVTEGQLFAGKSVKTMMGEHVVLVKSYTSTTKFIPRVSLPYLFTRSVEAIGDTSWPDEDLMRKCQKQAAEVQKPGNSISLAIARVGLSLMATHNGGEDECIGLYDLAFKQGFEDAVMDTHLLR